MALLRQMLALATVALLAVPLAACGEGGVDGGDNPRVRIANHRSQVVDVLLQAQPFVELGAFEFNDVAPGVTTGYLDVVPTTYEAHVRPEGTATEATVVFAARPGESYTILLPATEPVAPEVVTP